MKTIIIIAIINFLMGCSGILLNKSTIYHLFEFITGTLMLSVLFIAVGWRTAIISLITVLSITLIAYRYLYKEN